MILERIIETKKEEVDLLLKLQPLQEWENKAFAVNTPTRSLRQALEKPKRNMGIIAEIKKASPSKGLIRPSFDPKAIAQAYKQAGVDAISVLTDEQYFQGEIGYLQTVRDAVDVPVFRKDFVVHPVQVYQSRIAGADAFLLIAAVLTGEEMRHLSDLGQALGLETLIEVHNREEIEKVLPLRPRLLGINNRDLRTFHTTLETTVQLAPYIPPETLVVSESGINTSGDVRHLAEHGAKAVLVGESLMRRSDVKQAVIDLMGAVK